MSAKQPRPPREKKALSYARDRRNGYRENDKSSRKAIPLRKARENREDRRKANQAMAILPRADEPTADLVESSARQDVYRVGGWTKSPDVPLGKAVAAAIEARGRRAGRKALARAAGEP
ncbi:MAG TPA: hypothetical protein VF574_11150 [Allosphingosinicella sp.]